MSELAQHAERVQHSLVSSVGYYSHAFKEYTVKGRCACGWRLWVPISQVDQRWSAHIDGEDAQHG